MKRAEYNDWERAGDSLIAVKITTEGEHDPARVVAVIKLAMKILTDKSLPVIEL